MTTKRFTRGQLNAAARDRLDNPAPMKVVAYVPPKPALQITELARPGTGPYRVYEVDDFDSDFVGGGGTQYNTWDEALAAAKSAPTGYRRYVDNSAGMCVLKVVNPMRAH
ncbi:MAG TPA: hypothetical protein VFI95_02835 [Terriglobales bacterium]|nr:hypothetical protein [Terriglobales bacterium]